MYDEILDDPKVQRLSGDDFKAWVNLLCLTSKRDGKLPPIADIAFALRETEDAVSTLLERLSSGGLIEVRSGGANGAHHAPHGWDKRQYKSDASTERVKRFRQRSRNVTETADGTGPEPETESDTEQSPPYPPQTVGLARPDPKLLAKDLCKRAGISNPGPAATEHVRRWLNDGIAETTIRNVVMQMAARGGSTRSLKRFDQPIRREHAERKAIGLNGNGAARPMTAEQLGCAIAFAEDRGDQDRAEDLKRQLAAIVRGVTKSLSASESPRP